MSFDEDVCGGDGGVMVRLCLYSSRPVVQNHDSVLILIAIFQMLRVLGATTQRKRIVRVLSAACARLAPIRSFSSDFVFSLSPVSACASGDQERGQVSRKPTSRI